MHLSLSVLVLGAIPLVAGHCKITAAKGDLGGAGTGLGITANSGNSLDDVTIFSGAQGKTFGKTNGGGAIAPAKALPAALKLAGNTLPQVSTGGTVSMTLHQVNADGAGAMSCFVDATGNGSNFQAMTIMTNVPGNNGVSNAQNEDFPLVATMPPAVTCAGSVAGVNNLCFVKCQNPRGPFGSTVAVQMPGSKAGNGSSTGNDTSPGIAAGGAANSTAGNSSNAQGGKKAKKGKKNAGAKTGRAVGVRAFLMEYL